jgi:hypothetical protein
MSDFHLTTVQYMPLDHKLEAYFPTFCQPCRHAVCCSFLLTLSDFVLLELFEIIFFQRKRKVRLDEFSECIILLMMISLFVSQLGCSLA